MVKIDRIGEVKRNKESLGGYEMKIVECYGVRDIIVEFQDEYKARIHTNYSNFKKGVAKNPYHPNIYNIGFIGEGKYSNKTHTEIYKKWKSMLKRCYGEKSLKESPTYIGCSVCNEWHNFQNFAKWFEDNYYEITDERMELDKDILIKGNKIYSPETCIFVPKRINDLFIKSDARRGNYPIGVVEYYRKEDNYRKLCTHCSILDKEKGERKRKCLDYFPLDRPFQAFTCYKNFKENYIKRVADEYKDLIPVKLYDAMYKYEVEIND